MAGLRTIRTNAAPIRKSNITYPTGDVCSLKKRVIRPKARLEINATPGLCNSETLNLCEWICNRNSGGVVTKIMALWIQAERSGDGVVRELF